MDPPGQLLIETHSGVGGFVEAEGDAQHLVPLQRGGHQQFQVAPDSGTIGIEVPERVPLRYGVAGQLPLLSMSRVD
jgi:hypothetical protein